MVSSLPYKYNGLSLDLWYRKQSLYHLSHNQWPTEFLVSIFYFHYLHQSTKNNSINLITKEYRYVDARDSNPLFQDDRHRWIQWAMARLPSFLTIGVAWNWGFCFTASTMEASVTRWLDYFSIFGYFSTTKICPMAQIIGPKVQLIYPMAQIICHSKVQNYE